MAAHSEGHRTGRSGWLRAGVLGADDGLVSTASLVVGLVASGASDNAVMTAAVAALVAGALAMAIGEYVSVGTQADSERADRRREGRELQQDPEQEIAELEGIYVARGLSVELAASVARALHEHDPLSAHLRDELGQFDHSRARPSQAALVSGCSFALGSAIPLLTVVLAPATTRILAVSIFTVLSMCVLGAVGAGLGGAPPLRGALRVGIGGSLALVITYGIGRLLGATI